MNVEEHYRSTLDTLTRDRVGGPDLTSVIASGRRRRRVRRTGWAGAGAGVAVAAVAVAAVALSHHGSSTAGDPGLAGAPSYQDFVAGTDVDATLQTTIARHLPGLPSATEVYPSDWNHSAAIADFADATEWHAVYEVSGSEQLRVVLSDAIPGQPVDVRCAGLEQADIPCRRVELPDGSVETQSGYLLGTSTYRFMTVHVAPDGFVVEALDDVQADSVAAARAARELTDPATAALVRDPALRFPAPSHTPAFLAPQM